MEPVTHADLLRALGQTNYFEPWRLSGDDMTNPCGEIRINNQIITRERPPVYKSNTKVDIETATITVEVPGVVRDDIEAFTVDGTNSIVLYVKVKDQTVISRSLEVGEELQSVKLDLGILTVTIKRPYTKVSVEIS